MKRFKSIDMFSTNIKLYQTKRNKKTNLKTFSSDHSSIFGGILTIVCLFVTFLYLWNQITCMFDGKGDVITQMRKKNKFDDETKEAFIMNHTFFPMLHMKFK